MKVKARELGPQHRSPNGSIPVLVTLSTATGKVEVEWFRRGLSVIVIYDLDDEIEVQDD
jgi:hypothetical protein